jgi:hypothetical protein
VASVDDKAKKAEPPCDEVSNETYRPLLNLSLVNPLFVEVLLAQVGLQSFIRSAN